MELKLICENEDGSADFDMKVTSEEVQQLVRVGIIEVLKRAIEEGKTYEPSEVSVGDTGGGTKDCVHGTCIESDRANCNKLCGAFKVPSKE